MDTPTLVLIAGSWHQGRCFERLYKPLQEQHKLKCIPLTLPSTLGNPNTTLQEDIDAARSVISEELAQGHYVVVIAHSFGGMVGNSAIKGFTQSSMEAGNASKGCVIGIILIASGFTLTGLSFMDPMFGIPPTSWKVNKQSGFAELVTPPRELFYHDLPAEDAEYWVLQLGTQNLKAMFEGAEYAYAGWKDVPVWYIGTIEDRGLPVLVQRMQVAMAKAMGGNIVHLELQSSHSPFLSMPQECVEIVLAAISAFKEPLQPHTWAHQQTAKNSSSRIIKPSIRLLKPQTWISHGLPTALGYVLGACINALFWMKHCAKTRRSTADHVKDL